MDLSSPNRIKDSVKTRESDTSITICKDHLTNNFKIDIMINHLINSSKTDINEFISCVTSTISRIFSLRKSFKNTRSKTRAFKNPHANFQGDGSKLRNLCTAKGYGDGNLTTADTERQELGGELSTSISTRSQNQN